MKTKKNLIFHLGNLLIILSLLGFFYIFYPLVGIYLLPPHIQSISKRSGSFITIPKISAQAPITENVSPYDQAQYGQVLKHSVAHAKGTSLPGEKGTVFIFAHSSGPPWEITRYNTIFLRLNELKKGDIIELQRNKKTFKYRVEESKEVFPQEVNYLTNTKKNQLILQTCTPIGTDWKRLLIFALPAST